MGHMITGVPAAGTESRPSAAADDQAAFRLTDGSGASSRWQRKHVVLLAGIGALLGVLRAEASIDTDSLWQARFGIDTLTAGHLPRVDTYSWTAHGATWLPSSWAWNVVLGLADEAGGIAGIWLVGVLVAIGIALAVAVASSRLAAPPVPTVIAFALFGLLALFVSPRAEAVSNIFILVLPTLLPGLVTGARRQFVRYLVAICALQITWINLHSLALIGPIVLIVAGTGLLADRRLRGLRRVGSMRLGLVVILTAGCCLATPYGTAPLRHAAEVRSASVGLINEWDHIGFGSFAQILGLVVVVAGCALAWQAARAGRLSTALLLILFALATTSAIRFMSAELVTAMPELGVVLSRLHVRPLVLRRGLVLVVSTFAAMTIAHLGSFGRLDDAAGSPALVAELPAHCVLANDYELGGAVLLLRPDVKVSLDGRNDMYGRERVLSAVHLLQDRPGTQARLDAAGVNCVLAQTPYALVQRLRSNPAWTVVGSDSVRTLLVRKGR